MENSKETKNKNIFEENIEKISKSSECNPHFLEAYNRIAEKEFERMYKNKKKEKDNNITYTYSHPGIYRTFNYIENVTRIKRDMNLLNTKN